MQVHGPSVVLKDPAQQVHAYLNPAKTPFVVLNLGEVTVHVQTPAEADVLIAAAAEAKRLLDPPEPVWCPAETVLDDETFYCDRDHGHPGSHHAPGPDEGSEVAWGDEPADEDGPCMKVGCGHDYDDHSLDLEQGDRLYCQRCECRRFLSARAMRETASVAS